MDWSLPPRYRAKWWKRNTHFLFLGVLYNCAREVDMLAQTALKYDVEVNKNGQVEVSVPFPAGSHVTVFVIEAGESFGDLMGASQSSLAFWDNPYDDEDWNDA
jgi:hypothetical protein